MSLTVVCRVRVVNNAVTSEMLWAVTHVISPSCYDDLEKVPNGLLRLMCGHLYAAPGTSERPQAAVVDTVLIRE